MNDLTDRIREGDLNQITIVVYGVMFATYLEEHYRFHEKHGSPRSRSELAKELGYGIAEEALEVAKEAVISLENVLSDGRSEPKK